jgi:2-polyprenyl-3-methyl-5-hydroxy-6-metoxy-1,4-benzoquinol methylase
MEQVKCDLCGNNDWHPFLSTTDRFTGEKFCLVKCKHCDLIYLNPRPQIFEMQRYYPDEYEAYHLPIQQSSKFENWHIEHTLEKQLGYVEYFHSNRGRLLDVGCATGNFLNLAVRRGWQVLGLEIIEKAAIIARQQYNLEVITQNLESVELPDGSFDVVTLWDVLEHLSSPRDVLTRIHKLLRPMGMIFFSIPNLNSYDQYLFGRSWIGWDSPRHFTLFTNQTIKQLLDATEFEIVDRRCLIGGKGAFLLSTDQIIDKKPYLYWLKGIYPLISLLFWPYRKLAYATQKGPIIYYALRKK